MSTHDDDRPVDPALVDDALRRVTAADPAAGATLDTGRLHAALAASTGVRMPEHDEQPDEQHDEQHDELAAARARRLRRTRWVGAAAAVAAFAAVGGGGYAIGAQGGSPQVAAAISLDSSAAGASEEVDGAMDPAHPAEGPSSVGSLQVPAELQGGDDRMMPAWGYGGRQVFHGEGLSDATGEHAAWAFDAASVYSEATLRAAAKVFGVSGELSDEYGLTIGALDGSAPTVSLSADGLASIAYYDPTRDPWGCEQISMPDKPNGDVPEGAAEPGSTGGADCAQDGPSAKDATAAAEATLDDLGLDADDFTFDVTTDQGAGTNVLATLVVDGQATQAVWNFTVMADGVQSAYGPLAPVVELGDYDVVSAADAVERLNDPRFAGGWGGVWPLAASARGGAVLENKLDTEAATADEPTVPATPRAGDPIAWPVTQVAITDARLGVALQVLEDGASVLVPAYELSDGSGATWSVIAVADDQLDLTR
ncbi:hypothetical protein ACT17Q_14480 [Cellulomonas sp. CW35]|uniref:hypothetical protein n=1 Tax=Cellulomonas sp. CW35 TaxID=3458249 RepID=UPI000AD41663